MRGGYYPGLFFPELAKVTNEFVPLLEGAYYIRNIKGSLPGEGAPGVGRSDTKTVLCWTRTLGTSAVTVYVMLLVWELVLWCVGGRILVS
jgi:hypothetical protein